MYVHISLWRAIAPLCAASREKKMIFFSAIVALTSTDIMRFRCSRASDECNKKQPSDCDTLEYRNGEGTFALWSKSTFL